MESLLSALLAAGLIDADTADILRRQENEEQARQWAEQQLMIAAQGGLSAQQQRLLDLLQTTGNQPTARQVADFWRREDDLLWTAMRPQIEQVLTERATFAAVVGGDVGTFNLVNRQVIAWAETYYTSADDTTYGSIPNLNLTSRRQFADIFTAWNRGELPGRPRGLPSLIEALTPTFGTVRAERIAVTETTRVFTESIRQAGLANKFTTAFRVLTSADDRVCPICAPINGSVVAKTDERGFVHPERGSIGFPPFHVRCRCGITEETDATLRSGQPQPAPDDGRITINGDLAALEQAGVTRDQVARLFDIGPDALANIRIAGINGNGIEVNGTWTNSRTGEYIGECIRELYPAEKRAYLSALALEKQYIGNNTGVRIARAWFDTLSGAGYERADLYAGLTIGRYAWAKEGAQYADPESAAQATAKFQAWAIARGITDLKSGEFPKFATVLDVATWQHPRGRTLTGRDTGNQDVPPDMVLPLGKAFMLDMNMDGHGGWNGVIDLTQRRGGNGGR